MIGLTTSLSMFLKKSKMTGLKINSWAFVRTSSDKALPTTNAFVTLTLDEDTSRLVALGELVRLASEKQYSPRRKFVSPKLCVDGYSVCFLCGDWLPAASFSRDSQALNGLHAYCKKCNSDYSFRHRCTLRGFVLNLCAAAKHSASRRLSLGRTCAGEYELSMSFILSLLLEQQGRCAYSGVPLQMKPHSHWKCSLERVENSNGYIPTNVVLIAAEFQTPTQWSWSKVLSLPALIAHDTQNAVPCCMEGSAVVLQKSKCFCKIVLYNASRSARKRRLGGREIAGTFALTIDQVRKMVRQQSGLCAYSGVPLSFESGSDWQPSLERLDNSSGYIKNNVVLICREFQSADNSAKAATSTRVSGTSQWSHDKATQLLDWIRRSDVRQWIQRQEAIF